MYSDYENKYTKRPCIWVGLKAKLFENKMADNKVNKLRSSAVNKNMCFMFR